MNQYNLGRLGETIAKQDEIIKNTISNISKKENEIINEYKLLTKFNKHAQEPYKSEIQNHLEKNKLFLEYKLSTREQQCNALFTLLEYINILENKNKQLESHKILKKINEIENAMQPYIDL